MFLFCSSVFSYKQKIPKVLQESCLPEFEKLCWSKLSERQSKQRIEIKAMETILEQQILQGEHNQDESADIVADVNECGDDDNDDDVGPVLNWQDELFNVDLEPQTLDCPSNDEPASTYEQLVQKHIEAFYVGAQKYAQITELSKRIADWEARILPKLQEEETYGPFDIHVYGSKVLNSITKGSKVSLAKIMAGKPPHEVGRLFLSTLMLANAGNVELTCPGVLEEGMDKAEVTLLRTKLHFEELETYVAPSLANKDKEN
ncbi:NCAPH2 [Acanthosepion pharaonis]|uniref:NCAPH2 n=1 Tax=Acanthosepion pharaonis TaxID=158019 RepID=A0A812B7K2_ACAPH|nr:NCAPH2 [Sepia pharaonis]